MKKKMVLMVSVLSLSMALSVPVLANSSVTVNDIEVSEKSDFQEVVDMILELKSDNPDWTEEEIIVEMDDKIQAQRGIIDIWNSLTDSEKKLVVRYPFDALKVNEAKNVATSQTELKFGYNGLGDRSDAFRHGIWNGKMTILIGADKAELFATAHEDKDITGVESDGYSKEEHKNMDLHNNAIGRQLGELYSDSTDDELADIIYDAIYVENSEFVWLHE